MLVLGRTPYVLLTEQFNVSHKNARLSAGIKIGARKVIVHDIREISGRLVALLRFPQKTGGYSETVMGLDDRFPLSSRIDLFITHITGSGVRIGIEAPKNVQIRRFDYIG